MATTYINPDAKLWVHTYTTEVSLVREFHKRLPKYEMTPLIPQPLLAKQLQVKAVFAKDESSRMGLPAFKILGASWGVYRTIAAETNLPLDSSLEEVSVAAHRAGLSLFAATSGNHGRAIAYMARLLKIPATIFLADGPDEQVLTNVASEGAKVVVVEGNYDDAVAATALQVKNTKGALHVQDYSWDGYEEIAAWVIDGYSTMMYEVAQQLHDQGIDATHLVTPIGAGTLGLAVVAFAKSEDRGITVLAVEPESAACLNHNLKQEKLETIPTTKTIMTGMICGNVNPIAWPVLRHGVDVSVTITDHQCHEAIEWLRENNVNAGPCGASTLAGLWKVAATERAVAGLNDSSVVVLLTTEGKRYYKIPEQAQ